MVRRSVTARPATEPAMESGDRVQIDEAVRQGVVSHVGGRDGVARDGAEVLAVDQRHARVVGVEQAGRTLGDGFEDRLHVRG